MSFSTMIVNDSREDLFAWRCQQEDFEFGAKLVVQPSQQAVFMRDGKIVAVLGPGTHTLETSNMPFLRFFKLLRFGRYFSARVYFINHAVHKGIAWWLNQPVSCELDIGGGQSLPLDVRASGTMDLAIDKDRVVDFLNDLLGTGAELTHEAIQNKFNSVLNSVIQNYFANVLENLNTNAFTPRKQVAQIEAGLLESLAPEFAEFGIVLRRFYVDIIRMPEDDPAYQQAKLHRNREALGARQMDQELREADHAARMAEAKSRVTLIGEETAARATVLKAQGEAARRNLEGITSIQEHQFDTLNHMIDASTKMPASSGSGAFGDMTGMFGDMMQMSAKMQMMREMGGVMKGAMETGNQVGAAAVSATMGQPQPQGQTWTCANGHVNAEGNLFCAQCGQKKPVPQTWTCANGHINAEGNLFCPQCGQRKPAGKWICPNGHENAPESLFCSICGARKGG